jgi:exodeoxyribonuclease-5
MSVLAADVGADLVVIDECATGQLPPVMGTGYFTGRTPDFLLTEVHRQAANSPVIRLATLARGGRVLPQGRYGDSCVLVRASIDDMLAHDQILCGMNRTRHRINSEIRQKLGYHGATPVVGETVICLKNDRQNGLLNGTLWTVVGTAPPRNGFVALEVEDDARHRVEVEAPVDGFNLRDGNNAADLPGSRSITAMRSLVISPKGRNGGRCW